jgi:curved DNA-binding protein CbpA
MAEQEKELMGNHYEVLGLQRDADSQGIRKRHKKLGLCCIFALMPTC